MNHTILLNVLTVVHVPFVWSCHTKDTYIIGSPRGWGWITRGKLQKRRRQQRWILKANRTEFLTGRYALRFIRFINIVSFLKDGPSWSPWIHGLPNLTGPASCPHVPASTRESGVRFGAYRQIGRSRQNLAIELAFHTSVWQPRPSHLVISTISISNLGKAPKRHYTNRNRIKRGSAVLG